MNFNIYIFFIIGLRLSVINSVLVIKEWVIQQQDKQPKLRVIKGNIIIQVIKGSIIVIQVIVVVIRIRAFIMILHNFFTFHYLIPILTFTYKHSSITKRITY